jgi:hypothetical protein
LACCAEPHWVSIVVAPVHVVVAHRTARPGGTMLFDCSPACVTQPPITCSVRALDPVALQERRLDAAQQMGGVHPGEISLDHLAPADRGSDRVDDDGFSHDSLTFYLSGC